MKREQGGTDPAGTSPTDLDGLVESMSNLAGRPDLAVMLLALAHLTGACRNLRAAATEARPFSARLEFEAVFEGKRIKASFGPSDRKGFHTLREDGGFREEMDSGFLPVDTGGGTPGPAEGGKP